MIVPHTNRKKIMIRFQVKLTLLQTTWKRLARSSLTSYSNYLNAIRNFVFQRILYGGLQNSPQIPTAKMRLRKILKHLPVWVIQYKSEYHILTKRSFSKLTENSNTL
jgi:hypothetical protein